MFDIDPDDVVFIAADLGINNSIIWTDDKDFDKQTDIRIIKTKELVKLFSR